MKSQFLYRCSCTIIALIFILTSAGCAGNIPLPISQRANLFPGPCGFGGAECCKCRDNSHAAPVSDANILFQDDFTNPATGWPEDKFDNYFIGYHEPEYYHIEITSPNSKTTVFEPQKKSFEDVTIELDVLTVSAKTAAEGDFRYGLAFRRSGDQYYAFTISPRTKKWFVLKNSPSQ